MWAAALLLLCVLFAVIEQGNAACTCSTFHSLLAKLPSGKFPQYCYYLTSQQYTGADGCESACNSLGDAHAWVPLNADENAAVFEWVTQQIGNERLFTGVKEDDGVTTAGQMWAAADCFNNFSPGEPNSGGEGCLETVTGTFNEHGYLYNDISCGANRKCVCRKLCGDTALLGTPLLLALSRQQQCFGATAGTTDFAGAAAECSSDYPGSVPAPLSNQNDFWAYKEYALGVQDWLWTGYNDADDDGNWANVDGTVCEWTDPSANLKGYNDGECAAIDGGDAGIVEAESKNCGDSFRVLCMFDCPCVSGPCANGGTCSTDPYTSNGWACTCPVGYTGADCSVAAPATEGWVTGASSGECYALSPATASWLDALRYCRAVGADLASLHNTDHYNDHQTFATALGLSTVWLGGSDTMAEGGWSWTDASAWDYSMWVGGNPDNAGGNEDCLTNIIGQGFNDVPCTSSALHGVCAVTAIDPCTSSPCENMGTCAMADCGLTYTCTCHTPFTGANCDIESGEAVMSMCPQLGAAADRSTCYAENAVANRASMAIGDRCYVLLSAGFGSFTYNQGQCQSLYTDGHLGWLDHAFYKQLIEQLIRQHYAIAGSIAATNPTDHWRFGLQQYDTLAEPSGHWAWIDHTSTHACNHTVVSTEWLPGEPTDTSAAEHTAMAYVLSGTTDQDGNELLWNDVTDATAAHFVCQYRITQNTTADQCLSSPCQHGGTCVDGLNAFWCDCQWGTAGTLCEIDHDECASEPCQHGGTCTDSINMYTCTCEGYTGTHCETELNECDSSPCVNGGVCTDMYNAYSCACTAGWTGHTCALSIDECASTPCGPGGACTDGHLSYTCTCIAGYSGASCEIDIDECASAPCYNCLPCYDAVAGYTCDCGDTGYIGTHCQTLVDPCTPNPCQNSGTCTGGLTVYVCACTAGYTGTNCETATNECSSNPCQNGGACTASNGAYTCNCAADTSGTHCEYVNECVWSGPCGTRGDCSWVADGTLYECGCYYGWLGRDCQYDAVTVDATPQCSSRYNSLTTVTDAAMTYEWCYNYVRALDNTQWEGGEMALEESDTCTYRPASWLPTWTMAKDDKSGDCDWDCDGDNSQTCGGDKRYNVYGMTVSPTSNCTAWLCSNGGVCYDDVQSSWAALCACKPPWTGTTCAQDTDECASEPCLNGGTCTDGFASWSCNCVDGYSGDWCQLFDDCASSPCVNGATCLDQGAAYQCLCPLEWTGTNCDNVNDCRCHNCTNGATCLDLDNDYACACVLGFTGHWCETEIDECASVPCEQDSTCTDYLAFYECDCQAGFTDTNCQTNIDDCASTPCHNGTCYDVVVLYWCDCYNGYTGYLCETDIDECESGPCHPSATCLDLIGRYFCFCTPGYTGFECNVDIDECISDPCQHGGTCIDHVNYYTCSCVPGFSAYDCEIDINECISTPCQHGGSCDDRVNHYMCACMPGYTSVDCEIEVDECQSITCWNGGTCNDFIADYNCTCGAGFTDFHCETDIDECASTPCQYFDVCYEEMDECESAPCVNGTCYDRIGFYECECDPGYTGYDCETDIDECWSTPCQYWGTCTDLIAHYVCDCIPGITGFDCEINIDECESSPCNARDTNATCNDLINGFNCTCQPEWTDTYCDLETKIWEILQLFKAGALSDLSALRDVVAQSSLIVDSVPFVVGTMPKSAQWPLSWTTNDTIKWCTYEGKTCDIEKDIAAHVDPVMGTCFTFNDDSLAHYKIKRAGQGQGLVMYLLAGQADYAPWVDVAGFRLYIHNQSDSVYAESVPVSIQPGFSTIISLKWKEYKRLGGKYGRCINDKSEVKAFYYSGSYSADGCLRSCYQIEVEKACLCTDPRYPSPEGANICTLNERRCVNEFINTNGDPSKWTDCNLDDCPLPC